MASGQRQAELWGPSARLWAEKHEAYSLGLAEWLLDRVLTQPGQKLLDAGCGTGGALKIALARGARVTGTDVAPEMLEICRERVPQGEYFVADSEALPFVDGTFDAIIAQNSLQFTESPVKALREFARVKKPGAPIGIACFAATEYSDFATVGAAVRKLFTNPPTFEGPFSLSPPNRLHKVIADAGLSIVESAEHDLVREFMTFEEFWHGQAGTGATRYTVRELGEELVKSTMAEAMEQFTDAQGRIRMNNRFHVLIAK